MPRTENMYIEDKCDLVGDGRIALISRSKTGRTLYYQDRTFQSLKGYGYKSNYYDVETGEEYWISRPRRDGQDTLYPGIIQVDENVRLRYWSEIRKRPELSHTESFRSEGKYSRRRPQPEKPNRPAGRSGRRAQ